MTKSNVRTLNQRLEDHGIKFFPPSFCLTQEFEPPPFISPSFRFMEDTKNENWADVHFSGGVASQVVENHNTLFAGFLNPEGVAVWKVLSNFFFFFFYFSIIKPNDAKQIWKEIDSLLSDSTGVKDSQKIPRLAKRLIHLACLAWPSFQPNFYVHTLAFHLREYLEYLRSLSDQVGFKVTTKMLAQDAVEAGHK